MIYHNLQKDENGYLIEYMCCRYFAVKERRNYCCKLPLIDNTSFITILIHPEVCHHIHYMYKIAV